MTARFATADEIADWDNLLLANPDGGEFFQTKEFADIKSAQGWTPRFILVNNAAILALEKSVFGLGKLWYLPQGSGFTIETAQSFVDEITTFARKSGVFALKCEPQIKRSEDADQKLQQTGFAKSTDVQPTMSTIWLDVRGETDEIEASFGSKTRYNIRQARKGGVVCREMPANDETYEAFYQLFTETADGRFVIRPYEYYRKFWSAYCESGHGIIMFAYDGDKLASADFVMILGEKASRKDAGSTRQKTTRGAPALLVLETIRVLKTRGVTDYDLCGAPESSRIKDQTHPLYGVGQFKAGFSEEVTDYAGTYLLPIRPIAAKLWLRYVEKIVRALHFRLKHQAWY